jgi:hypothetical protein
MKKMENYHCHYAVVMIAGLSSQMKEDRKVGKNIEIDFDQLQGYASF